MEFCHSTHYLFFYHSSINLQNTTIGLMVHNFDEGMRLWKLKIDPCEKEGLVIEPVACTIYLHVFHL